MTQATRASQTVIKRTPQTHAMTRFTLAVILPLAILVGCGAAMTMDTSISGGRSPTPQIAVLAIVFNALAAIMTPLTSAAGGVTSMPIAGETLHLWLLPTVAWALAGLASGLMAGDAKRAIPASLTVSGLTYILWMLASITVLPAVQSSTPWQLYITKISSQIFWEAPLDFAALFAIPAATSAAIALFEPIPPASKPAHPAIQPTRRRFWQYDE